ncbi:hypothetical protein [Streptomyces sp. NPDC090131]|uniref:hypothetical protein n=1 Tax=Streptomyces sp. NPDC090131 TaxID=3365954 RepID=UPI0037F124C4
MADLGAAPPVVASLGLGGIAAIGIGIAPALAGLFLWFRPQARAYVSLPPAHWTCAAI